MKLNRNSCECKSRQNPNRYKIAIRDKIVKEINVEYS